MQMHLQDMFLLPLSWNQIAMPESSLYKDYRVTTSSPLENERTTQKVTAKKNASWIHSHFSHSWDENFQSRDDIYHHFDKGTYEGAISSFKY